MPASHLEFPHVSAETCGGNVRTRRSVSSEVILERLVAEFAHVGVGGVRLEVRVVEEAGEVIERIAFGHGSLQSTKRYVNAVTL